MLNLIVSQLGLFVEGGMHPFELMKIMGWSPPKMAGTYTNPERERLLQAMQPVTNLSQATAEHRGLRLVNG
jgi:hypothetical protein